MIGSFYGSYAKGAMIGSFYGSYAKGAMIGSFYGSYAKGAMIGSFYGSYAKGAMIGSFYGSYAKGAMIGSFYGSYAKGAMIGSFYGSYAKGAMIGSFYGSYAKGAMIGSFYGSYAKGAMIGSFYGSYAKGAMIGSFYGSYAKGAMIGSIQAPSPNSFLTELTIRTALNMACGHAASLSVDLSGHLNVFPLQFDDLFIFPSVLRSLVPLCCRALSPPMKASETTDSKPLSKEDQLSYVSNILLEDCDMQALNWNCDMFEEKEACPTTAQLEDGPEDFLWKELGKGFDEKLVSSMLSSSPLLSDIDTSIFEEIAGSTLDCQALMENTPEGSEATSDYSSTGGELSNYSSSDSEEEIDVVTVREQEEAEQQRLALQRHNAEIQQQHNYAAPCPASPPPSSSHAHKRLRDGSTRHHPHRNHHHHHSASSTSSSSSRFSCRVSADMEDEEERRRTHNVMERQRRNELKNCFMLLRDNVPELTRNDKASKVVILKKARDCIYSLEEDAHRLQKKETN
ncbi:hypothetical protein WMY93_011335 [Mugilogobius chulae]|uniref:BHLH domain-containing protein n=1 Tax=Mugilogobius chulae TaxID=88201 RepID=A0AAW0P671_9GOBI